MGPAISISGVKDSNRGGRSRSDKDVVLRKSPVNPFPIRDAGRLHLLEGEGKRLQPIGGGASSSDLHGAMDDGLEE
jgi:hypothetical protein